MLPAEPQDRVFGVREVHDLVRGVQLTALEELLQNVGAVDAVERVGYVEGESRLGDGIVVWCEEGLEDKGGHSGSVLDSNPELLRAEFGSDVSGDLVHGHCCCNAIEYLPHRNGPRPAVGLGYSDQHRSQQKLLGRALQVVVADVGDDGANGFAARGVAEEREE